MFKQLFFDDQRLFLRENTKRHYGTLYSYSGDGEQMMFADCGLFTNLGQSIPRKGF